MRTIKSTSLYVLLAALGVIFVEDGDEYVQSKEKKSKRMKACENAVKAADAFQDFIYEKTGNANLEEYQKLSEELRQYTEVTSTAKGGAVKVAGICCMLYMFADKEGQLGALPLISQYAAFLKVCKINPKTFRREATEIANRVAPTLSKDPSRS